MQVVSFGEWLLDLLPSAWASLIAVGAVFGVAFRLGVRSIVPLTERLTAVGAQPISHLRPSERDERRRELRTALVPLVLLLLVVIGGSLFVTVSLWRALGGHPEVAPLLGPIAEPSILFGVVHAVIPAVRMARRNGAVSVRRFVAFFIASSALYSLMPRGLLVFLTSSLVFNALLRQLPAERPR